LVRLACRGDWISPHTQRSLKRRDTVAVSAVLGLAERGQVDVFVNPFPARRTS